MAKPPPEKTIHVLCGSHWDREWRYNYEQSLLKLVELIDRAMDLLEKNRDFGAFHLDGGVVMLEDYVKVKPENAERLKILIRDRRIVMTPWYTLPEMFSVSGEAIIRNMMFGHRVSEAFGRVLKIGYTPTSYGQISQLPQIYSNFGIQDIFFYRGLNKYVAPPLFWWESPDGTRALDFRLFDDFARSNFQFRVYRPLIGGLTYRDYDYRGLPGRLFHLAGEDAYRDSYHLLEPGPEAYDGDKIRACVSDLIDNAKQNCLVPGHYLAMHQEDNAIPFESLIQLLRNIENACPKTSVQCESLRDYVLFVRGNLGDAALEKLPVLKGEMRHCDVDGFWGGLNGSGISARVDLKIANEASENSLEKRAEPLVCSAWLLDRMAYPVERLTSAWKSLLENHAHDSINGCSMDQVHRDMMYRFDKARLIGVELSTRAMSAMTAQMGHPVAKKGDFVVGVFNNTGWEGNCAVTAILDLPLAGPHRRFELVDPDGNIVNAQVERIGPTNAYVTCDLVVGMHVKSERHKVTFMAEKLPPVGWKTYLLRPLPMAEPVGGDFYEDGRRDFRTQVIGPLAMQNEHLKVEVRSDGTFDLTDIETGKRFEKLNYFEDGGDAGHAVAYCAPAKDEIVTSLGSPCRISIIEDGALRTTIQVETSISVPLELELNKLSRSLARVTIPITTRVRLCAGARFVEIETEFDNQARDHRLRAVFPSGLANASQATAAIPFDVVEREIKAPDCAYWKEPYLATQPFSSFVDVFDGECGLALFSKGLKEYEVTDDPSRPIKLTLVRGQRGSMSVNGPETRDELKNAGRYVFGKIQTRMAICPHAGDWESAGLYRKYAEFRNSPEVIQFQPPQKGGQAEKRLLEIGPADLVLSAIKKAEDRDNLIVRLFNPTAKDLKGFLKSDAIIAKAAYLVRMDESRISELRLEKDGKIAFDAPHKKILTIEIVR